MPFVTRLSLSLVVLAILGTQAQAASTSWWTWGQAWRTPAAQGYETTSMPTVVYTVERSWTPGAGVSATIPLFTLPAPTVASYSTSIWGYSTPSSVGYNAAPAFSYAPVPQGVVPFDHDAFINLGEGPYDAESMLTTGNARPWYESPVVTKLYGGTPDAQQRAEFSHNVLERAEQAFARSGIPNVSFTDDPNASAAHTLSVVSGTSYGPNPNAVGIANMGGDGFSFIDKLIYADTVDELQWAVAHNVAHELMHGFGVEHRDATGQFLDSATAPWEVLVSPSTVFGPDAVAALLAENFRDRPDLTGSYTYNAQMLDHGPACPCAAHLLASPSPVPEPTTWALWGVLAGTAWMGHRRRRTRCQVA